PYQVTVWPGGMYSSARYSASSAFCRSLRLIASTPDRPIRPPSRARAISAALAGPGLAWSSPVDTHAAGTVNATRRTIACRIRNTTAILIASNSALCPKLDRPHAYLGRHGPDEKRHGLRE